MAFSADGALYVTDSDCHQVRRVQPDGTIRPVVGTGHDACGSYNDPAREVRRSKRCASAPTATSTSPIRSAASSYASTAREQATCSQPPPRP